MVTGASWLPPGTYDLSARVDDGRAGVLRGLTLGARETKDLTVLVERCARVKTRTLAPAGRLSSITVEWDGVLVWSWWGGEETHERDRPSRRDPRGLVGVGEWNGTTRARGATQPCVSGR